MSLPEDLDKLLPAKVIEKAYDDAASPAAKEVGKAAVDLVKTAVPGAGNRLRHGAMLIAIILA